MEAIQFLGDGFAVALQPQNLLIALIGCFVGTLIGALPGLGPVATIAMLLPIAFTLDPASALILLGAIYYGSMYGGTITAVLLDIPGEVSSVMTAVDGFEMAKQGRAGVALGIAAAGSFVAGTVSVVFLTLLGPSLSMLGLKFGPPEYFALAVLGLTMVSGLVGREPVKGYLMMVLGLALTTVGSDPISAVSRLTFGELTLMDGIQFLPVAIGLFGVAEVLEQIERPLTGDIRAFASVKLRSLFPSRSEWKQSFGPIVRGTGLGFFAGLLPGAGASVGSFVAYGVEQKISKHPETFGKGELKGLASAEAANNGSTGGSLLPMLTLGIPGSATTAVLMFALITMGLSPGPQLFVNSPEVVWPFIASMYVGNVMLVLMNTGFIPFFVWLVRLGSKLLVPIIIALCIVGVYASSFRMFDVWVMLVFGVLGFVLRKRGYPAVPLILGIVLGPLVEQSLRQSLVISQGSMSVLFSSGISTVLICLAAVIVLLPVVGRFRRGARRRRSGAPGIPDADHSAQGDDRS